MSDDLADQELLKSLAYKKPKEFLLIHPEYRPGILARLKLAYFLFLRRRGWPIAYISGHKEFYGLDFLVNRHTLIPRPETEILVDEAVRILNTKYQILNTLLIDVGTGTGCIPISIAKKLDTACHSEGFTHTPRSGGEGPKARGGLANGWPRKFLTHPYPAQAGNGGRTDGDPSHSFGMTIVAVDISRSALRLAKKNALHHGVNINFVHGNLLSPIIKYLNISISKYSKIVITANLPYLTVEQFKSESSIQHEPQKALVADNKDGLRLYEKLLAQIQSLISNIQYRNILILLEIDPRQVEGIKKLARQYLPDFSCEIKKDLTGLDRLIKISRIVKQIPADLRRIFTDTISV